MVHYFSSFIVKHKTFYINICNSELYFLMGKICFSTLLDIVRIKNGSSISMCCDNIFEINVIRFNSYGVNNNLVTTYGGDGMFAS